MADKFYMAAISPSDVMAVEELFVILDLDPVTMCFRWSGGKADGHWEAFSHVLEGVPVACQCCDSGEWKTGAHE